MNKMNKIGTTFACLLILLCSGCIQLSPSGESTADWFGTQIPLDNWDVITMSDPLRLGMIQNRMIDGCQVTIMTNDPLFVAGNPGGWKGIREETSTSKIRIDRITVKDDPGEIHMIYYEIFVASEVTPPKRLAYYQVEWKEDAAKCSRAFQVLLDSIDPADFPDLPVAQG